MTLVQRTAVQALKPELRVLLIDDRPEPTGRKLRLLPRHSDLPLATHSTTVAGALAAIVAQRPHVAVIDTLPDRRRALDVCHAIEALGTTTRVVVLSLDHSEESVRATMLAGARGYLTEGESVGSLRRALREVASGHLVLSEAITPLMRRLLEAGRPAGDELKTLTSREVEIVKHLGRGAKNRDIAGELGISSKTVEAHVRQVLLKLRVRTRTHAAIRAVRAGLC